MQVATYTPAPVFHGEQLHNAGHAVEPYGLTSGHASWSAPTHQGFSHMVPDQADMRNQMAQLQGQLLASYVRFRPSSPLADHQNREQQLKDRINDIDPPRETRRDEKQESSQPDPSAEAIKALEQKVEQLELVATQEAAKRKEAEGRERGAIKNLSAIAKDKHEATVKADALERSLKEAQDKAASTERVLQEHVRTDRAELERLRSQRAVDGNQNRMVKEQLGRAEHEMERLKDKLRSLRFENDALLKRVDELSKDNAALSATQKRSTSLVQQSVLKMPNGAAAYHRREQMTAMSAQLELLG
ncbi:hypothetical protein Q8F55_002353 [Vanrija albida]|uniref:Uncharacterized protein n=1 Tax=Vanrija albida TaxID=181172 RepID=A0ABR3QA44_9TREE